MLIYRKYLTESSKTIINMFLYVRLLGLLSGSSIKISKGWLIFLPSFLSAYSPISLIASIIKV